MSLGSKGCDLSHSLVLSLGCLPASIHAIAIRLLEGQDQEKKTGTVKEIEREEAGDVRDLGGLVSSFLSRTDVWHTVLNLHTAQGVCREMQHLERRLPLRSYHSHGSQQLLR